MPKVRLAVTYIATLALWGCASTPLQEVRDFGKASSSFATDGSKSFKLLTDSLAEGDLWTIAADPTANLTADTFKGSDDERSIKDSARKLTAILVNVSEYGQGLQKLAEANFKKDIDDSATKLNNSLEGLRSTFEKDSGSKLKISSTDIQILSAAVEGIGVLVAEAKRKHAIRQIVLKTDPAIQQVSHRLAARFKHDIGPAVETYYSAAEAPLTTMYKEFNTNQSWKTKSYSERLDREEEIGKQEAVKQGIKPLFDQLSKTAQQMGEAHAALAKAVEHDTFTTADLHAQVVALVDYAESVKKFYDSLATENKN
jgi:predicted regulator of Ras-like GTPase activity (Roadblock/LC7/MglB family)